MPHSNPDKVTCCRTHHGQILHLTLDDPPGNILDRRMMEKLSLEIRKAKTDRDLKAILFEGRGNHFSYGASIQEHRREEAAEMLSTFRSLFEDLIALSLPIASVVRGRCLGGGMELASFSSWVFASSEASFGQPEVHLAVFAPFASIFLPEQTTRCRAEDILLTGKTLSASEALQAGLAHSVSTDPHQTAIGYLEEWILPKSAIALRHTFRASRTLLHQRFREQIPHIEAQYLRELMETRDANEGIESFLAKRPPQWRNQ